MSRDFANVSTDFLSRSGAAVTAVPLSVFCWANFDDATGTEGLIGLGISGSAFNKFTLGCNSGSALMVAISSDASTSLTLQGSYGHSTGVWEPCSAAWSGTTTTQVWINGNKTTSGATLKIPSGINYTSIGQQPDGATGLTNGRIAHVAIWNVLLTDQEQGSLHNGRVSPLKLRPASLVAYYPFIGRDSPEIDVIGGNSLTVNGTTVSASDPPVLWLPGRRTILIPAAGPAPAFSSGPSINSTTTSAYTIGYTPTAACTFYAVAIVSGGTAPTAAQVIAGVDYAGGDVVAAANEAVTGADTTVLGGSLTRPVHDVYCALSNGGGDSAVAALTGSRLSADAGRQYFTASEPGGGWDVESIFYAASPAAVTGDIGDISTTMTAATGGGETCEVTSDGIIAYTPIPSDDLTRRTITRRFWDVSIDAWSDASPVLFYINNQSPIGPTTTESFVFVIGSNGTDIDLDDVFTDPELQTMTYATTPASTSFPSWASISGTSIVIGTPASANDVTVSVRATDDTGIDYDDGLFRLVSTQGPQVVPDLYGLDSVAAFEALDAAFLALGTITIKSSARQGGLVIEQSPIAGATADAGSEVAIVLSSGDVIRYDLQARGRKFAQY